MDLLGYLELPNYAVIIGFIICLYIYGRWPYSYLKSFGIPGPDPSTFFGSMCTLRKMGIVDFDKHMIKKYGKVSGFYQGNLPVMLIADPDMIKQICVKEFSNFTNRFDIVPPDGIFKSFLTSAKDDHWKFIRSVLTPTFSSKRMRQMVPLIDIAIQNLDWTLEHVSSTGEDVDIRKVFSSYTMDVMLSTSFGIDVNSQKYPDQPLITSTRVFFRIEIFGIMMFNCVLLKPMFYFFTKLKIPNKFTRGIAFLTKYCKELITDRKNNPDSNQNDLLQLMLSAKLEDTDTESKNTLNTPKFESMHEWRTRRGLTDDEIIAQTLLTIMVGLETTSVTLGYLAHSLALNSEIQERLYEEIHSILGEDEPDYENVQKLIYLDMCMAETLRMYPNAPRINREAKRNMCINGWTIPTDTDINIPIYAIHHMPEYWPQPETFDPERFTPEAKAARNPFTYLPFGAGPRMCLAMRLAQLQLKMAMVKVVRKYKFVRCSKTEEVMEFDKRYLGLVAKNGIWTKVERR